MCLDQAANTLAASLAPRGPQPGHSPTPPWSPPPRRLSAAGHRGHHRPALTRRSGGRCADRADPGYAVFRGADRRRGAALRLPVASTPTPAFQHLGRGYDTARGREGPVRPDVQGDREVPVYDPAERSTPEKPPTPDRRRPKHPEARSHRDPGRAVRRGRRIVRGCGGDDNRTRTSTPPGRPNLDPHRQ